MKVKQNNLYELGRHTLFYGDATKKMSYNALFDKEPKLDLLLTDLPYNENYSESDGKFLMITSSIDTMGENIKLQC